MTESCLEIRPEFSLPLSTDHEVTLILPFHAGCKTEGSMARVETMVIRATSSCASLVFSGDAQSFHALITSI